MLFWLKNRRPEYQLFAVVSAPRWERNKQSIEMNAFESESTIEERRKQRQEEWEKVRQPDQPECKSKWRNNCYLVQNRIYLFSKVAPEEPYDGRSLYDRLKEQRDAKDSEFEEARKFKNMIRGLDVSWFFLMAFHVKHIHNVRTTMWITFHKLMTGNCWRCGSKWKRNRMSWTTTAPKELNCTSCRPIRWDCEIDTSTSNLTLLP